MDSISSAEFRKQYAGLRKPTYVTVNGHVIGHWIPEGSATYVAGRTEVFGLEPPPPGAVTRAPEPLDPTFRFGTSHPAPKPGKVNRGEK